ncbi:nucleotide sugar dehydrogenase [Brevibacillus composti]|uniref:Nucleotide sugar dehydrogenase n=1 Tax=Brevibacillus composti TaxID=2796470 RepID=A0A7T5EHD9_9BACL|nr:nucleotide sugar dehydrogenase [Brevibacillus composti]QQE72666.1 nucleotide sugar dehydrogenase [Brevibacillus composti]QUO39744.1 nucleotide sugar dehydrogenase [Brevibacillus composti]
MTADKEKAAPVVAIIGLGYVGLPLAMLFASKRVSVIGIDVDTKKVEMLHSGRSYLTDIHDREIRSLFETGCFEATHDFAEVRFAQAIILCVPTPLRDHSYPDLSYVQAAAKSLVPYLHNGQLIVLESSTFPGTTEEVLLPIFARSGLLAGKDFFLGYSPERIDPGNKAFSLEEIPKVISGISPACLEKVKEIYGLAFQHLVPVSSPKAAEMTKLLENSQRFVNISFMNEFAMICAEMGIDVWEVIEAAKTKPYGFTAYYPGPGIGGHCIPVDPLYLQWKAKHYDQETRFIQLAKAINDQMPDYIISRILKLLGSEKPLTQQQILLIGLTYKKDVNDVRESTALAILEKLDSMELNVAYHDPLVPELRVNGREIGSTPLSPTGLSTYDCVVLLTDHTGLPYEMIGDHARLLFDTRRVYTRSQNNLISL